MKPFRQWSTRRQALAGVGALFALLVLIQLGERVIGPAEQEPAFDFESRTPAGAPAGPPEVRRLGERRVEARFAGNSVRIGTDSRAEADELESCFREGLAVAFPVAAPGEDPGLDRAEAEAAFARVRDECTHTVVSLPPLPPQKPE